VVLPLCAVLLAVLAITFETLRFGGAFTRVESRFDGACRAVELGGSAEDIQIDRERGVAYLSLLDRDKVSHGEPLLGTIMLMDLNLQEPAPRAAMAFDPADFRPHGFSLLRQAGQPLRLFAISHPTAQRHVVEIAEQDAGGGFFPKSTVSDATFTHPNALVAVGPAQFYLVNDQPVQTGWQRAWSVLLRSGNASLVYFDGTAAKVLVDDLKYPAGLAMSPDGTRLYVGEALAKALRVYRVLSPGELQLERTVELGTAPDNLNVDADGVVWIAAHPKLLRFLGHARDASKRAPTQVLRYDPQDGNTPAAEVYVDDGSTLSAGTVAARWREEFLVGALLDKKVLVCKPNP
jgi:arylesterase/paraoxonase